MEKYGRISSGAKFSVGGAPIALTKGGEDLYRPAIATDGRGRLWVFWSANEKGNFDLWACSLDNGKPGRSLRITTAPGSDIDPVAATDPKGRVWVAWQAWRNGKAEIHSATQQGESFSREAVVSSSRANEWNPAIAAGEGGSLAVAWESYRNGNYDLYYRTPKRTVPGARRNPWRIRRDMRHILRWLTRPADVRDPRTSQVFSPSKIMSIQGCRISSARKGSFIYKDSGPLAPSADTKRG
jgi:hypothetical protein